MSAIPITIAALQSLPAVTAAVGPRIFPVVAPQGAELPHVVVNVGSEAEPYAFDGATDHAEARVSVVVRASTAKATGDIGAAVIAGLKNRRDGATTFYRDDVDLTDFLEATGTYRRVLGFIVTYANA